MKVENVSAAILAGGSSKRMGTKKAELKLGDQTLLEITVQKLQKMGIKDIMISGYDEAVSGTRAVKDIYTGKGPIAGVHASLKAAEKPACLIVGVDTPFLPAEVLTGLVEAHEGPATVLKTSEHIEPLIAVYDADLAARAEELIQKDDWSLQRMTNNPEVKKVEFTGDPDLLLNCNTPEDYEKAKTLWK